MIYRPQVYRAQADRYAGIAGDYELDLSEAERDAFDLLAEAYQRMIPLAEARWKGIPQQEGIRFNE